MMSILRGGILGKVVLECMRLRKAFAANLKRARATKGFSQEELADRAKLDRTYISALERCVYAVSLDVLERLADALTLPPSDLLKE